MSEKNIPRSFYCNHEQLQQLNIFKKNVERITPYYSDEIQEYLFVNNKENYIEYMYSDSIEISKKLYKDNKVVFIDYISINFNLTEGENYIAFYIFDSLNDIEIKIDKGAIDLDNIGKEGWGLIVLELDDSGEKPLYSLKKFDLFPFSIEKESFESFLSLRKDYSLSDWTSLLLHSLGYSSTNLTFKEKFTILARAIPYCQENFSLLEIGSRGTGKSKFYKNFNNKKTKRLTGKASAASLFYNNSTKKSGDTVNNDVLIMDEVHNMSFDDEMSTNFKSFIEEGMFTRGQELHSDCSVVFLGNYDNFHEASNNPMMILDGLKNNFFKDTAIIDRLSFISYGWEAQPYVRPQESFEGKILQTYLVKIFQELREQDFYKLIEEKINFNNQLKDRDRKNLMDVVSGLLKLLHPNKEVRDKELISYLEIATENLKYRVELKKYFENSNNSVNTNRKTEFKLHLPIFTPKNDAYRDKVDIINKEFILYNYIDLFKSNYSLKDFIPIAKEFELDNSSNTCVNFFPITKIKEKKKEIKIIGDILTIEHPYFNDEFLNIAISLTGIHANEEKIQFYNNLKEKKLDSLKNFEEPGYFLDNYLLLSSKMPNSSFANSSLFKMDCLLNINLKEQHIKLTTNFLKDGFIPYYTKNIYNSEDFELNKIFINYSYFHLINDINTQINISSFNYIVNEEIYEIEYTNLQPKKSGFGQPRFNEPEMKKERLNISDLIELLEEKKL